MITKHISKEARLSYTLPVVPQAAEFTYILFTQEINTRDTSGRHGLSDLNKHYFQLEFS